MLLLCDGWCIIFGFRFREVVLGFGLTVFESRDDGVDYLGVDDAFGSPVFKDLRRFV